jgi:hypothetical protein
VVAGAVVELLQDRGADAVHAGAQGIVAGGVVREIHGYVRGEDAMM